MLSCIVAAKRSGRFPRADVVGGGYVEMGDGEPCWMTVGGLLFLGSWNQKQARLAWAQDGKRMEATR